MNPKLGFIIGWGGIAMLGFVAGVNELSFDIDDGIVGVFLGNSALGIMAIGCALGTVAFIITFLTLVRVRAQLASFQLQAGPDAELQEVLA